MKAHAGRLVLRLSQGSACHAAMGQASPGQLWRFIVHLELSRCGVAGASQLADHNRINSGERSGNLRGLNGSFARKRGPLFWTGRA